MDPNETYSFPDDDDYENADTRPGNTFQAKIWLLIFVRTINNKRNYQLNSTTQWDKISGKFDDFLILMADSESRPIAQNDSTNCCIASDDSGPPAMKNTNTQKSYFYLQVKQRLCEEPNHKTKNITTADLLNDNNGDFSLAKCFHSYRGNILKTPEKPQDGDHLNYVICTNIGFDRDEFPETFQHQALEDIDLKPLEAQRISNMYWLVNTLRLCAEQADFVPEKKKALNHQEPEFLSYLADLFAHKVLISHQEDEQKHGFHPDFIEDNPTEKRSPIVEKLRKELIGLTKFHKQPDGWKQWTWFSTNIASYIVRQQRVKEQATIKLVPISFEDHLLSPLLPELLFLTTEKQPKIKNPILYRLEPVRWLDLHYVAVVLRDCAASKPKDPRLDKQSDVFKSYLVALLKGDVIDRIPFDSSSSAHQHKFHKNFTEDGGDKVHNVLRQILNQLEGNDSWKDWTFTISNTCLSTFSNNQCLFDGIENRELDDPETKEELDNFFGNQLVFAVKTPNDKELDDVLRNEIITMERTIQVFHWPIRCPLLERACWIHNKKMWSHYLFREEERKNALLKNIENEIAQMRAISLSVSYQKRLNPICEFNQQAIGAMARQLNSLFENPAQLICIDNLDKCVKSHQEVYITTLAPKLTAIKVIAALKHVDFSRKDDFGHDGGFFLTSSSNLLQHDYEKECMTSIMKGENEPKLMVVVRDDNDVKVHVSGYGGIGFITLLFNQLDWAYRGRKMIIILSEEMFERHCYYFSTNDNYSHIRDRIKYGHLSENVAEMLIKTKISFLGAEKSVQDLIPGDAIKDVINPPSLAEFLLKTEDIVVSSIVTPSRIENFLQSHYINRRIKMIFNQHQLRVELANELDCSVEKLKNESGSATIFRFGTELSVDENGKIEWLNVQDERKKEIWEKMKLILEKNKSSSPTQTFAVDKLSDDLKYSSDVVIISGVAGAGKSSLLWRCFQLIKEKHPDWWVIRIDFAQHLEALRTTSTIDESNVFDFIDSLSDAMVPNKSSFAHSLLNYRLKTGDRIVLMLDGFDEIDSHCRTKAIQLIKAVRVSKLLRIFVATRQHTSSELQFQLSQLAYTLDEFDEKDQIECLVKFWKDDLLKQQKETLNTDELENYAQMIVKKVNKNFKEDDRNFIGIPLQCRIVAECFLEQARSIMTQTDINQGEHQELQEFDLANYYDRLMETKQKLFVRQKLQISCSLNEETEEQRLFIEETMKNIHDHLLKLAIEKIVCNREHVDLLLPPRSFDFQSHESRLKNQERLDKLSVSYGLTYKNGQGKIEFLHQTYAEYLVANYLYQGFALDEKCQNLLMEVKSTFCFITKVVMTKVEYVGVLAFLDSMLKRLVESERWHSLINEKRNLAEMTPSMLPARYRIADAVAKNLKFYDFSIIRKANVLTLVWDCLDATFHRIKVRQIVRDIIEETKSIFSLDVNILKRFLQYYSDANYNEIEDIFRMIFENWTYDKEGVEELALVAFSFMKEHRKFLQRYLQSSNKYIYIKSPHLQLWDMALCLLANSIDRSDLETSFDVLSIYENNVPLELQNLLQGTLFTDNCFNVPQWIGSRQMEKMLIELRTRKFQKTLEGISQLVLVGDPHLFESFYAPELPPKINLSSSDIETLLLTRNSCGLTLLQRASFYNDTKVLEKILVALCSDSALREEKLANFIIGQSVSSYYTYRGLDVPILEFSNSLYELEKGGSMIGFAHEGLTDFNVTPFFIAALRGHEDIGRHLIEFTQKHGQLLDALIYSSLKDAVRRTRIDVYEFILKLVKQVLGQSKLVDLCRSLISDKSPFGLFIKRVSSSKSVESAVNIVFLDDDRSVESYAFLSELFLSSSNFRQLFKKQIDCEILQGMLKTVEVDWIRQFFQKEAECGFHLLTRHFRMEVLDEAQRQKLSTAIITPTMNKEFLEQPKFLDWIVDVLGENEIKNFMLRYDSNGDFCFETLFNLENLHRNLLTNVALAHFNDVEIKQVRISLAEKATRVIKAKLFAEQHKGINLALNNLSPPKLLNVFKFYLEHASENLLSTFVNDLTAIRVIKSRNCSLCSYALSPDTDMKEIQDFVKLLSERLGEESVEMLVLHKNEKGDLILADNDYFAKEDQVTEMYSHLSKRKQDEIRHKLLEAVSKSSQIEKWLARNEEHLISKLVKRYLGIDERGVATDLPDGFNVLSLFFMEKFTAAQIRQFVRLVTTQFLLTPSFNNELDYSKGIGRSYYYSIWSDYVAKASAADEYDNMVRSLSWESPNSGCKAIEKLFKIIKKKFNHDEEGVLLEELVNGGVGCALEFAGQNGNLPMVEMMSSQFNDSSALRRETYSKLIVTRGVWKTRFAINGHFGALVDLRRQLLAIKNETKATNLVEGLDLIYLYFFREFDKECRLLFFSLSLRATNICGRLDRNNIWVDYIEKVVNESDFSRRLMYKSNNYATIVNVFTVANKVVEKDKNRIRKMIIDMTMKGLKKAETRRTKQNTCLWNMNAGIISALIIQYLAMSKTEQDFQFRRDAWKQLNQYWFALPRELDLNYFVERLDRMELVEFVDSILNIYDDDKETGRRRSIWDDYIGKSSGEKEVFYHKTLFRQIIMNDMSSDKDGEPKIMIENYGPTVLMLLKRLQHELGVDEMKRLLNHDANGNQGPAILRHLKEISSRGGQDLSESLNRYRVFAQYLTEEKHQKKFLQLLPPSPDFIHPLSYNQVPQQSMEKETKNCCTFQ